MSAEYFEEQRRQLIAAIRANTDQVTAQSGKAALDMLTQAMAKAFAPDVSVNCVAPGWIDLGPQPTAEANRFAAKTPMQRNGAEEDVAQAVLFFAIGPGFITGQILAVDGGLGLS